MSRSFDPYEAFHGLYVEYTRSAQLVRDWDGVVEEDVLYLSANIPIATVNLVASARFDAETADTRIDHVISWFRARAMPIGWWACDRDTPTDLGTRLKAKGFAGDETFPGMVADLDNVKAEAPPVGVEIERVRDTATYEIASATLAAGFGGPPELGDVFAAMSTLGFDEDAAARTYLASLDGEPVATSLGLLVDDVIGVFNVATLEHARRRGIGRAVTLAAMIDGALRGGRVAVLQASKAGHGVYGALGFRDFGSYRLFTLAS